MNESTIFRREAIERYNQSREKSVLPMFIRPHMFIIFWLLVGLLLALFCTAWFAHYPIYISGHGVVIEGSETHMKMLVIAPLSAKPFATDDIIRFTGVDGELYINQVTSIELLIQTPDSIYDRYSQYKTQLSNVVTQPSWVATAEFENIPLSETYLGSQHPIQVEVGTERLISLMPLIGDWVGGRS